MKMDNETKMLLIDILKALETIESLSMVLRPSQIGLHQVSCDDAAWPIRKQRAEQFNISSILS